MVRGENAIRKQATDQAFRVQKPGKSPLTSASRTGAVISSDHRRCRPAVSAARRTTVEMSVRKSKFGVPQLIRLFNRVDVLWTELDLFADGSDFRAGADAASARVRGTIQTQMRGDKVIVFKFKRKKQYKRTIGHRQNLTEVAISEILA